MKMTDSPLAAALPIACLLCLACSAMAAPRSADETRVLAALSKAHPGTRFTDIARTPIPALYEVWMGSNVAFVSDKNLRYLVFGRMFDTRTMTDLTAPKLAQAERLNIKAEEQDATPHFRIGQLPLADAIKTVHGNGGDVSRSLIVFSDPACPYCKQLEPELDQLDNVTIHTFLLPFQGYALASGIWCAADRQKSWRQAMHKDEQVKAGGPAAMVSSAAPPAATPCAHPLDRNLALARQLRIHGTPTILYANGRRTDGYIGAADIESHMKAAPDAASGSDAAATASQQHAIYPHQKEAAQ